jgi:hypothetical protein
VQQADVIVAAHPCATDCRTLAEMQPSVPIIDAAGELSRQLDPDARAKLKLVYVLDPPPAATRR